MEKFEILLEARRWLGVRDTEPAKDVDHALEVLWDRGVRGVYGLQLAARDALQIKQPCPF